MMIRRNFGAGKHNTRWTSWNVSASAKKKKKSVSVRTGIDISKALQEHKTHMCESAKLIYAPGAEGERGGQEEKLDKHAHGVR